MAKGMLRPVLLRLNPWRCLCSVVPNTPLVYLRWEDNEKGYAGLKGRRLCLLPQSAPLAQRSFAACATVGWACYRYGNNVFI